MTWSVWDAKVYNDVLAKRQEYMAKVLENWIQVGLNVWMKETTMTEKDRVKTMVTVLDEFIANAGKMHRDQESRIKTVREFLEGKAAEPEQDALHAVYWVEGRMWYVNEMGQDGYPIFTRCREDAWLSRLQDDLLGYVKERKGIDGMTLVNVKVGDEPPEAVVKAGDVIEGVGTVIKAVDTITYTTSRIGPLVKVNLDVVPADQINTHTMRDQLAKDEEINIHLEKMEPKEETKWVLKDLNDNTYLSHCEWVKVLDNARLFDSKEDIDKECAARSYNIREEYLEVIVKDGKVSLKPVCGLKEIPAGKATTVQHERRFGVRFGEDAYLCRTPADSQSFSLGAKDGGYGWGFLLTFGEHSPRRFTRQEAEKWLAEFKKASSSLKNITQYNEKLLGVVEISEDHKTVTPVKDYVIWTWNQPHSRKLYWDGVSFAMIPAAEAKRFSTQDQADNLIAGMTWEKVEVEAVEPKPEAVEPARKYVIRLNRFGEYVLMAGDQIGWTIPAREDRSPATRFNFDHAVKVMDQIKETRCVAFSVEGMRTEEVKE